MNKKDNKSKFNIIRGLVVAGFGIICGLWLLICREVISGGEFVTLSLGFSVIGLIIVFAAEVQEFSIAGNGVKLKELRSQAENTIEELRQGRTELFRILVKASIEFSGGFGSSSKVESRAEKFIHIFNEIEKINCVKELKSDLEKSLYIILLSQYSKLSFIHQTPKGLNDGFSTSDKADFLYIKLNDQLIRDSYKGRTPEPNFEDEKTDIINGIDVYSKLYAIKVKLENLEIDNA